MSKDTATISFEGCEKYDFDDVRIQAKKKKFVDISKYFQDLFIKDIEGKKTDNLYVYIISLMGFAIIIMLLLYLINS